MQEHMVMVKNKLGLHARPAAIFVQTAGKFKSKVKLIKDDQEVDGKSIMGIMTLAASSGTSIKIIVDGVDEGEAVSALQALFLNGFGEE